ncbi:MAG: LysR family transcriptional regulator [Anaerotruncus sp.]|nr:LysR family transcriptional regulator [Anaerotruncus sp.]
MKKSYNEWKGALLLKIAVLEYFIALAESSSINEAAQKLYIAQPSLTKSLQSFEKELGVQLFLRKKSGIQLTEAGKKILPEAKQVVAYYNGWLNLSSQRTLEVVDVYIQSSFPNFILPNVVLQFKKLHPNVQINCTLNRTPEQYISQNTERPVLVLFICNQENPVEKYIKIQGNHPIVLFEGEYCCLVSKHSNLAKKERVTPADLKDYYLAMTSSVDSPSSALAPLLNRIIPIVSVSHAMQLESVNAVINLVASSPEVYALSYYPILKRYERVAEGELVYVPFQDSFAKGDFCLFYSKQAHHQYPALQELVTTIQADATRFLSETASQSAL